MILRSNAVRVDNLVREIQRDCSVIDREQSELMSAVRETAREPGTLAWAFAAGTLVGTRQAAGSSSSTAARIAGAVRVTARTWSKVRLLGSLTQELR